MKKLIYCITTVEKWEQSNVEGKYADKSLETEGFIHCSYPHQLLQVANKHFKGIDNLLILRIDCSQLKCNVVDEDLSGLNEVYPHIYGSINIDAVVDTLKFQFDLNGNFTLPGQGIKGYQ